MSAVRKRLLDLITHSTHLTIHPPNQIPTRPFTTTTTHLPATQLIIHPPYHPPIHPHYHLLTSQPIPPDHTPTLQATQQTIHPAYLSTPPEHPPTLRPYHTQLYIPTGHLTIQPHYHLPDHSQLYIPTPICPTIFNCTYPLPT